MIWILTLVLAGSVDGDVKEQKEEMMTRIKIMKASTAELVDEDEVMIDPRDAVFSSRAREPEIPCWLPGHCDTRLRLEGSNVVFSTA